MFKTSAKGLKLIQEFEGFRTKPYLCSAGVPTIGWGSTRYEDGTAVKLSDKAITKERADQMLYNDLKSFERTVNSSVKVPITQNQFDALVCFTYNVGSNAFKTSTMLKLINAKKYKEAALQFARWNKAGGKEVAGLTRRRLAESTLFNS